MSSQQPMDERYYAQGGGKTPAAASVIRSYLLRHGAVGDVLDFGCGAGQMLETLAPYAGKLAGVDVSVAALSLAQARVPRADVRLIGGYSLPYQDNSFDTVVMCDVLEHLRRPVDVLEEAKRVLRVNGRLIVTTPNANSLLRYIRRTQWFGLQDPSHIIFYTNFSLTQILRRTGFQSVTICAEALTPQPSRFIINALRCGGTLVGIARR